MTWLLGLGTLMVSIVVIGHLAVALVLIIPTWRICARAGFSGALSLLHLLPFFIGAFIIMAVLAFGTWPAGEAASRRP